MDTAEGAEKRWWTYGLITFTFPSAQNVLSEIILKFHSFTLFWPLFMSLQSRLP